jgi:hypothetical protein
MSVSGSSSSWGSWVVQSHRPIAKVEENLWTVDGDIRLPGGVFVRKMTLMRLSDGRIAIHSAIALAEPDMAEIERWGEPAFCIVPNRRHRLDAPAFRRRYPALKIISPAAVRSLVDPVVTVDGGYEMLPREIEWRTLALKGDEAALVFRNNERATIVFGDALFNVPHFGDALGWMLRLLGSTGGPRVTPLAKRVVVANKKELASEFRDLAATAGLVRLVPGHGDNVEGNAAEVLCQVADRI